MSERSWRSAAAAVFVCGWGGNQFTPLLVMYRAAGYSALTVNALLGAYVVGLVPGLLAAGALSGRLGRRPVMAVGLLASLLASVLVALGVHGVAWIAVGRFMTGLGVAAAMAVGTTWVVELSRASGADGVTGARRGALWLTLGFGLGAGVAGLLAQWAPFPMVLPYAAHAALVVAVLPFSCRAPETRRTGVRAVASRFHGVRDPRFRWVILPMAPWIFGSAGVAYAIMPQLVAPQLGPWRLLYSTLLTVCTLGVGALVQPLAKRLDTTSSARAVAVAMAVMSVGLAVGTAAAVVRSPVVAFVAAVTLGAAYGIAVVSGLLELQRIARGGDLATLTGVYYMLAYVGFLLPTLLALLSSVAGYSVLLGCLVLVALAGTAVILSHSRAHLPGGLGTAAAAGSPPAESAQVGWATEPELGRPQGGVRARCTRPRRRTGTRPVPPGNESLPERIDRQLTSGLPGTRSRLAPGGLRGPADTPCSDGWDRPSPARRTPGDAGSSHPSL